MADQHKPAPGGRIGPNPRRHRTLHGDQREKVRSVMAKEYVAGDSIRAIKDRHDRSYGQVRNLLLEAGVKLRHRGGPRGSSPRDGQD